VKTSLTLAILLVTLSCTEVTAQETELDTYVGVTLLAPGGINFAYMKDLSPKHGIKISGGYISDNEGSYIAGAQVDYLRAWARKGGYRSNLVLAAGHTTFSDEGIIDRWTYAMAGVNLRLYGFFLETGFSYGFGDFSNPVLVLEVGVLFGA